MSGLAMSLFHALDSADIVEIDGCEVQDRFQEPSPSRRVIRLATEEVVDFADQTISIAAGRASFRDLSGQQHHARFAVERPLQADVDDLLF